MPSTYTLNNGIELIGTGEQSGTWGDTTNTNFELIDTALDGQVTVTLASAGSSGAPNTLPISDGSSSNGRNRMVIFDDGGDLGATAYVQLTPSDAEKIVYVRNDLSGSRSIILFQGTYNASNDYEVPAGTTAVVYFDGAGAGAVAANVFNNAYFDSLRLGSVSVTAILDEDDMVSDSATALATQQSIKKYVDDKTAAQNELSEVLANGNTTGGTDIAVSSGDDITFADNSKVIFGAGSDLQIYHDGSGSYIKEEGAGSLFVQSNGVGIILEHTDGTNLLFADAGNQAVTLYNGGSAKLATTSTGVDITGAFTATTTGTVPTIYGGSGASQTFTLQSTSGNSNHSKVLIGNAVGADNGGISFYSAGASVATERMRIAGTNGDITFYDASGNASFVYDESAGSTFNEQGDNKDFRVESDTNTSALFVDASTSRIGINSNAPAVPLHVAGVDGTSVRMITANADAAGNNFMDFYNSVGRMGYLGYASGSADIFYIWNEQSSNVIAGTNNVEHMRFHPTDGTVFNEQGVDQDFRVESNSKSHAIFLDAANNKIAFNNTTSAVGTSDTSLLFRMPQAAGKAVFVHDSGDGGVVISGSGSASQAALMFGNNWTTDDGTGYTEEYRIVMDGSNDSLQFKYNNNTETAFNLSSGGYVTAYKGAVFNEDGGDSDFRVESNGNANMLFVDAGTDRVYVGTATGSSGNLVVASNAGANGIQINARVGNDYGFLNFYNNAADTAWGAIAGYSGTGLLFYQGTTEIFRINSSGAVFNEEGNDKDFRVESDTDTHALFVDAGNSRVGIGSTSPANVLDLGSATGNRGISWGNTSGNYTNIWAKYSNGNLVLATGLAPKTDATGYVSSYESASLGHSVLEIGAFGNPGKLTFSSLLAQNQPVGTELFPLERFSASTTAFVVNDGGIDYDFRVESDAFTHALFVDAANNRVSIGESTDVPNATLEVKGGVGMTSGWDRTLQIAGDSGSGFPVMVWNSRDTGYAGIGYDATNTTTPMKFWTGATTSDVALDGQRALELGIAGGETVVNNESYDIDFRVESDTQSHALFVDASSSAAVVSINTSGVGTTLNGTATARLYVDGAIRTGNTVMYGISNPNGKVFTFNTGANGNAAFLKLTCTDHQGIRETVFRAFNASGNWTVVGADTVTNGTAPTFTIAGNGTANPTITVSCNTSYSGGFLQIQTSAGSISVS